MFRKLIFFYIILVQAAYANIQSLKKELFDSKYKLEHAEKSKKSMIFNELKNQAMNASKKIPDTISEKDVKDVFFIYQISDNLSSIELDELNPKTCSQLEALVRSRENPKDTKKDTETIKFSVDIIKTLCKK